MYPWMLYRGITKKYPRLSNDCVTPLVASKTPISARGQRSNPQIFPRPPGQMLSLASLEFQTYTLPETNSSHPEIGPASKGNESSSNHPFSGAIR